MTRLALASTPLLLLLSLPAASQQAAIPVRALTAAVSTDSGVIANIYVIRYLSDGHVLLNDGLLHRLLLIDSTMKGYKVLADTAGEGPNNFGSASGGLLPFLGDSTVFIDRTSPAFIVVDPSGKFGRVMSPPKATDVPFLNVPSNGMPGFDARGRLFYHGGFVAPPMPPFGGVLDTILVTVDSAPIIRANLETRHLDTIAMLGIPVLTRKIIRGPMGTSTRTLTNPLAFTDEWALLPDGTVAIVRGRDYHIDWFLPDGTHESSARMPFDWKRVSPEDKQRMVDSVLSAIEKQQRATMGAPPIGPNGKPVPAAEWYGPINIVSASVLPDYYPPVRPGQMRADLEGNVWILPTTSTSASGGLLWDVVNRKGEIFERVQLPAGRNLHGFGPNGIVYMSVPVQVGWPRLERARVIRPAPPGKQD